MKKICLILFLMLVPTTAFPYKITNSPASTIPVTLALTKGKRPDLLTRKARYVLQPGQSGAWNQNEIRKKLKVENLTLFVLYGSTKRRELENWIEQWDFFKIDKMPINANVNILATVDKEKQKPIGGAVDLSTGNVYNWASLSAAARLIRNKSPEKRQIINPFLQLLKQVK